VARPVPIDDVERLTPTRFQELTRAVPLAVAARGALPLVGAWTTTGVNSLLGPGLVRGDVRDLIRLALQHEDLSCKIRPDVVL
jgi:hypothetical protein